VVLREDVEGDQHNVHHRAVVGHILEVSRANGDPRQSRLHDEHRDGAHLDYRNANADECNQKARGSQVESRADPQIWGPRITRLQGLTYSQTKNKKVIAIY
jgi:hypothetical protein